MMRLTAAAGRHTAAQRYMLLASRATVGRLFSVGCVDWVFVRVVVVKESESVLGLW